MHSMQAQPSLKERQRREREALILQAAEEAFSDKGYYDTSMEEIAARVGVAKGTVYLHFPCKEALVVAIFTRDMELFLQEIDTALAAEVTARAKLETLLTSMSSGLRRKRAQFLSSIYHGVDLRRLLAENSSRIQALWERLASKIASILEEGKATGEIHATLPTAMMLLALFSFFSPRSVAYPGLKDSFSEEEFVRFMGQIFFDGIMVKTADSTRI